MAVGGQVVGGVEGSGGGIAAVLEGHGIDVTGGDTVAVDEAELDGTLIPSVATDSEVAAVVATLQPLNAILTDLAGLTQATDKLIYFNSATTAATTTFTATARSLLDDDSVSAMRTTLELGTAALQEMSDGQEAALAGTTGTPSDSNRYLTELGPRGNVPWNSYRLMQLLDAIDPTDAVNLGQLLSAVEAAVSGQTLKAPVYAVSTAALPAHSRSGNTLTASANGTLSSAFGSTAAAAFSGGAFLAKFGTSGSGNGQFNGLHDADDDTSNNIFTTERTNKRVQKFNSSGTYQSQFGAAVQAHKYVRVATTAALPANSLTAGPGGIEAIVADANGALPSIDGVSLAVGERLLAKNEATSARNGVYRVISLGSGSSKWQLFRDTDSDSDAENPLGEVVGATEGTTNGSKYFEKTADSSQGGTYSSGTGTRFGEPAGIAIDGSNNIYVVDRQLDQVVKFNSSGVYQSAFGFTGTGNGQLTYPDGVAVDGSGNVFVVDRGNNRVQKFNSSGVYQWQTGSFGTGNGQFNNPIDLVIDGSGNLFVTDYGNNRVQKFNSSGTYQSQFGSAGSGNGAFNGPTAIYIDGSNNMWVADYSNNRIQKFNSSGTYQSQFGTFGSGNGQFNSPLGGFLVSTTLWVADSGNTRMQKFDLSASTASKTVLVRHEGSGSHLENGIYTIDAPGSAGSVWVMTRRSDADESGEITFGSLVQAIWENDQSGGFFYQSAADPIDINVTAQVWGRKSGIGVYHGAGTTLPTGVSVGDTYTYKADDTNGVFWQLLYDGVGTRPWKVIGGSALVAVVDTAQARTTTGYGDLTTVGPDITVPLLGDYDVQVGCFVFTTTAGDASFMSYDVGGTTAVDADAARQQDNDTSFTGKSIVSELRRKTSVAASSLIRSKYKPQNTDGATWSNRWLSVMPVRVG